MHEQQQQQQQQQPPHPQHPDPYLTPPPFRGRILTKTPATPFDSSLSNAPAPAGHFLIVRGVGLGDPTKENPVALVEAKLAELRAAHPSLNSIPVQVHPIFIRDPTTQGDAGTTNHESIPKSTQGYGSEDDYKLKYMDEWEPLPPLGSVEHDDVDRKIERFEAPGIDFTTPDRVQTDDTHPAPATRFPFQPSAIVISTPAPAIATGAQVATQPSAVGNVQVSTTGTSWTHGVPEAERGDHFLTVQCAQQGCKTIWFHADCVPAWIVRIVGINHCLDRGNYTLKGKYDVMDDGTGSPELPKIKIRDRDPLATTACYIKLDRSLDSFDPAAEPRVDLLQLWMDKLREHASEWETAWAPQREGKDKRCWVRVNNIFDEEPGDVFGGKRKRDPNEEKYVAATRKAFDDAGMKSINGFRSGKGVIVHLRHPSLVDKAVEQATIHVPDISRKHLPVYSVRQIEVQNAFEIVVGGLSGQSNASVGHVTSWFASFSRDGQTLLAAVRQPPNEKDFVVFTMDDWAATADVLKNAENFTKEFPDYRPPQLLFKLNTVGSWKPSTAAVITEGADKVSDAVAALTRRIDKNERDARARDEDTKHRISQIDLNLVTLTTVTTNLATRQEELGRGMFIMQQESQLSVALGRIDAAMMMARQTHARPIDDEEKKA
ncbi:hypothetical protein C8R43DRAFT_943175 [Mycena crocata]|nr:hypothetical protein C8R43DRAFT_943175 [Mycena crocata]